MFRLHRVEWMMSWSVDCFDGLIERLNLTSTEPRREDAKTYFFTIIMYKQIITLFKQIGKMPVRLFFHHTWPTSTRLQRTVVHTQAWDLQHDSNWSMMPHMQHSLWFWLRSSKSQNIVAQRLRRIDGQLQGKEVSRGTTQIRCEIVRAGRRVDCATNSLWEQVYIR